MCAGLYLFTAIIVAFGANGACVATANMNVTLDVVERLSKLVAHYKHHETGVNVDGLYGLRIAQGAVVASVEGLNTSSNSTERQQLLDKISVLSDSINSLCDVVTNVVAQRDPKYFSSFRPVIGHAFSLGSLQPQILNGTPQATDRSYSSFYNETHGDICFKKLMGTFHFHQTSYKCFADKDCLDLMTTPSQSRYSLTHQLLYFIIAQKMSCRPLLDMLLAPKTVQLHQTFLCEKILVENNHFLTINGSSVAGPNLDIFIEQAVLCSMLGFVEFINERRLTAVLEYQDTTFGCYKPLKWVKRETVARTKRRGQTDKDFCEAHVTGLAAAYMGLYIQYNSMSIDV